MAQEDWVFEKNADNIGVTENQAQAGTAALKYDGTNGLNNDVAVVLDQSKTDAPAEARVTTYLRWNNVGGDPVGGADTSYGGVHAAFFRWQVADNYYLLSMTPEWADEAGNNVGDPAVIFGKLVGGGFTELDFEFDPNFNKNADTWFQMRYSLWEDDGVVFGRIEQMRGGNWEIVAQDLTDPNPDLGAGGGVGVGEAITHANSVVMAGTAANHDRGRTAWWDEVEVRYST